MAKRIASTLEIHRVDGDIETIAGVHKYMKFQMQYELTQIDVIKCVIAGVRDGEEFEYTQFGDYSRNGTFDINGVGAFDEGHALWNML